MITCQQRLAQATIETIVFQYLCCDRPKAKKLAGELCKHREKPWRRMLSNHKHGQHIFVSAEEFSVPLTNQNTLKISQRLPTHMASGCTSQSSSLVKLITQSHATFILQESLIAVKSSRNLLPIPSKACCATTAGPGDHRNCKLTKKTLHTKTKS